MIGNRYFMFKVSSDRFATHQNTSYTPRSPWQVQTQDAKWSTNANVYDVSCYASNRFDIVQLHTIDMWRRSSIYGVKTIEKIFVNTRSTGGKPTKSQSSQNLTSRLWPCGMQFMFRLVVLSFVYWNTSDVSRTIRPVFLIRNGQVPNIENYRTGYERLNYQRHSSMSNIRSKFWHT